MHRGSEKQLWRKLFKSDLLHFYQSESWIKLKKIGFVSFFFSAGYYLCILQMTVFNSILIIIIIIIIFGYSVLLFGLPG